jgi:Domain of Unknown Function (DUF1080)
MRLNEKAETMKTDKAIRRQAILTATLLLCLALLPARAQDKVLRPDLGKLAEGKGWKLVNRTVKTAEKDGQTSVRFSDGNGIGIAWLENFAFTNGTIEFDVRGTNVLQHSFVGVAFHGADDQTYDAVYFRPFNFKNEDAARRLRAVQYISHPTNTWSKLRQEQPGKFEQSVTPAPDPNGWFHVRVVVTHPKVSVFVNETKEPCLVVDQLSDRKSGRIGLWVDVGGGEFANLKIK